MQYESTLVPGVGNYNPRVLLIWCRSAPKHKHQTVRCSASQKSGAKFTDRQLRKNHRKPPIWPPTTPKLPTTNFLTALLKKNRTRTSWARLIDSNPKLGSSYHLINTQSYKCGEEKLQTKRKFKGMVLSPCRRDLAKVSTIIDRPFLGSSDCMFVIFYCYLC